MIDMIDIIYIWIELEIGIELCDGIVWWNCVILVTVTGPEPGIRWDANPVASRRRRPWLAGAWVCVIKCPGGSSPPKIYLYDCDMIDIIYIWIVLEFGIELCDGIVWYWNGHWSGTRNPVWRKSGGESKAASLARWGLSLCDQVPGWFKSPEIIYMIWLWCDWWFSVELWIDMKYSEPACSFYFYAIYIFIMNI